MKTKFDINPPVVQLSATTEAGLRRASRSQHSAPQKLPVSRPVLRRALASGVFILLAQIWVPWRVWESRVQRRDGRRVLAAAQSGRASVSTRPPGSAHSSRPGLSAGPDAPAVLEQGLELRRPGLVRWQLTPGPGPRRPSQSPEFHGVGLRSWKVSVSQWGVDNRCHRTPAGRKWDLAALAGAGANSRPHGGPGCQGEAPAEPSGLAWCSGGCSRDNDGTSSPSIFPSLNRN